MKILIVCEHNVNRSVTLAGQLKWLGNDVLTAGYHANDPATIELLGEWADVIIATDDVPTELWDLQAHVGDMPDKVEVWDVGPDNYPRAYHPRLLHLAKEFIYEHPELDNRPLTRTHPEKGIKKP